MKLYAKIAQTAKGIENCIASGNDTWRVAHELTLVGLASDHLPHGSGFDSGCTIESASEKRIVISAPYHAVNENGFYDGWDECTVTVTPSLLFGFNLRVTGGRRDNREYIAEIIQDALQSEV